jgi:hypothetical protein
MKEPMIRFPVVCPDCGEECLAEFSIAVLADSLIRNDKIRLRAVCHDTGWIASPSEIAQVRAYMSVQRQEG